MTLRTRIFILITLIVLVILGISLLLVVKFKNNPTVTPPVIESPVVQVQSNVVLPSTPATVIPQNITVAPIDSADVTENTVRQLAKIFVERFNTYSSDNMYQNIRDVEVLVTSDYWKKISLPLSRPASPPATFVALTTKVLAIPSSNVLSTVASVTLKAQKTNTNGDKTVSSYADYTVSLVKSGSNWLVVSQTEKK